MKSTNKPFEARKLLYIKKFTIPFSILLALILWLIITVTGSPNSENTITGLAISIPTENSLVSELGLDVIDNVERFSASVTVKGPAYVVGSISEKDISVMASVSNVTNAGTYELELRAVKQSGSLSGEFEIASVSPSVITVTFDYIDTKNFTVTPIAIGASAVDGLVAESPIVSDSNYATLKFKGPRTDMEKIDKVTATAEVNNVLSKTQSFNAKLQIFDKNGGELNLKDFTITTADGNEAPNIKISVPISKVKTVPLIAEFDNLPGVYAQGIHTTLSETSIDIIGPAETVDSINEIKLGKIDFDQVSNSKATFEVAPVLPDGIKSVDHIEKVSVTLNNIDSFTTRTFTVNTGEVKGSVSGSAVLSRSIKNVKICGPRAVLGKLTDKDFYAEIDGTGQSAGEHTVTARIKCKSTNTVWQVGTYEATITVK